MTGSVSLELTFKPETTLKLNTNVQIYKESERQSFRCIAYSYKSGVFHAYLFVRKVKRMGVVDC